MCASDSVCRIAVAKKRKLLAASGMSSVRERLLRRGDGKIDITAIAIRDLRIRLPRRRFDVVEIFSADRLNKLAVNEVSNFRVGFHRLRARASKQEIKH